MKSKESSRARDGDLIEARAGDIEFDLWAARAEETRVYSDCAHPRVFFFFFGILKDICVSGLEVVWESWFLLVGNCSRTRKNARIK